MKRFFLPSKRFLGLSRLAWKGIAIVGVVAGYVLHFRFCADSALPEFARFFTNSDMHGNLLWAEGIVEQGWLNPRPHHPYHAWMRSIAPYETWLAWWGGPNLFLRSPLYAYVLAAFLKWSGNLLAFHLFQCLLGAALCMLLGLVAAAVFEDRRVGWLALAIAALYSPFYGYSWPLLRDLMSWTALALSLLLLTRWWRAWSSHRPSAALSWATGFSLGLGLLVRETYYLILPLSLLWIVAISFRRRSYGPAVWIGIGWALAVAPLAIRNGRVGAPMLSTSDRFVECCVVGNASSAKPNLPWMTPEMEGIFRRADGDHSRVVLETLRTYRDRPWQWGLLYFRKTLSLFDPFEPPDNLNLYFMREISPLVRWGLPHWLVLIPGIGGLMLGLWRRDRRQIWLWIFLLCLFAGLMLNPVLSRFRQALAVLWIPWAAFFAAAVWDLFRRRSFRKLGAALAFLGVGWGLCLGPLALQPRRDYYRPTEYRLAAFIHERWGEKEKAREMMDLCRRRNMSHAE